MDPEPRPNKRVLVMCQRKVSNLTQHVNSVAKTVSDINTYIKTHFGGDATIEYLTYHHQEPQENYADHIFELSESNDKKEQIINFLEDHKEHYDIIILNTCPIRWLDFGMIYKILSKDGILVVKLFGNKESSPRLIPQEQLDEITSTITSKSLFIKQEAAVFGNLAFKKASIPSPGGGKKLKKVYTRLKSRRRLKETRRKKRKRRAIK